MKRQLIWVEAHDPLPDSSQALTAAEGANGLLAAGADLGPDRLIQAYSRGIFPWFSRGEPVLWWTPDPRMVLYLDDFAISKSFRKTIRRAQENPDLSITCDQDFAGVMRACAAPRQGQAGTWISAPMISAYQTLQRQGLAHSLEVRARGELVGGLYCVAIGQMVFGESMFSQQPDASKLALATLVAWLQQHGGLVIDCQQHTGHLASLGAREIGRREFEAHVSTLIKSPTLPWQSTPPGKESLQAFA
jgi:leucyl/phenylalanyl-tRNA---protein transferase